MQHLLPGAERGVDQDTWTLRFSGQGLDGKSMAMSVAESFRLIGVIHGADVSEGFGVWDGSVEPSVTVTTQASQGIVEALLEELALVFRQDIRFVHVERSTPSTQYVDLNHHRVAAW